MFTTKKNLATLQGSTFGKRTIDSKTRFNRKQAVA
jgi:hypothetical protein